MLKIVKFTDICMAGGIMHTPSHTNVCKFFNFQHTFSQLICHLKFVFEFSAAILEKGLLKKINKLKYNFLKIIKMETRKLSKLNRIARNMNC